MKVFMKTGNSSNGISQTLNLQKQPYRISTKTLSRVDDALEIFLGAVAYAKQTDSALYGSLAGLGLTLLDTNSQGSSLGVEKSRANRVRSICNSLVIGATMYVVDRPAVPFLAGCFGILALERRLRQFADGL